MELQTINNFLGIDISKDCFDVFLSFISKKGKRETRKRNFKNDDNGFQGLQNFLQKHNVEEVKACMESAGCYSEALAWFLHILEKQVHRSDKVMMNLLYNILPA